jgi:Flp pilus assembly pilin Flp
VRKPDSVLNRGRKRAAALARTEEGYQTMEYALLVAFIALPLYKIVPYLLDMLRFYFHLISFTIALPFP